MHESVGMDTWKQSITTSGEDLLGLALEVARVLQTATQIFVAQ